MKFNTFYYLNEQVLKNWQSAISQSEELKVAVELMGKINDAGFEALIVGGSVRDLVLGKAPNDFDLTANASPEQIEQIFGKTIDIGKNKIMGVSVVPYKGFQFEISSYRKDLYQDNSKGKGADTVELTTSFKDDASRRDLTINQLGIDKDGNIIDHHNGLSDIQNKIISTVGDPNLRFKEDQIRTMRAVRFASRLGFQIDSKTIDAIKSNAPEIKKVASERILKELWKMSEQSGSRFADAIIMLRDVGLLQYILPEIEVMKDFEHTPSHHPEGGVFSHTMAALRTYKGTDPVVNFAILLHDIGKPSTYVHDEIKGHTYHGHEGASKQLIEDLAKRLKLDNDTKEALIFASTNHMNFHHILEMNNSTIAKMIKSPYFDILQQVALADTSSRGNLFDQKEWDAIQNKINKVRDIVKDSNKKDPVKEVVNGALIMRLRPDIKQGIQFGKIIKDTIEYVLNNEIDLKDINTIETFIKEWKG